MVMQVFRSGDDGDNFQAEPSPPVVEQTENLKEFGRRWFCDPGVETKNNTSNQTRACVPNPHFLKLTVLKPAFGFQKPKPA